MRWGKWNNFSIEGARDKFLARVEIRQETNCRIWKGAIGSHKRYGILSMAGRHWLAHRAAWFLFKDEDPKEKCVCHTCDNGFCVNPDHLFLGTQGDNVRDMESKKLSFHPKHEAHGRAKLKWKDVRQIRKLYKNGMAIRAIARIFTIVDRVTISSVVKNKTWITK